MKNFEKDYIDEMNSAAPDMDELWKRIENSEAEDDDITPFLSAADESSRSKGKAFRTLAAAAAVFAAVFCLRLLIRTDDSVLLDESTSYESNYENYDDAAEEEPDSDEPESNGGMLLVTPENGWDYASSVSSHGVSDYEMLSLANTDTPAYTGIGYDEDNAYFVEEDVLSDTDYFVDGRIISTEIYPDHAVYTMEVIHLISDAGKEISKEFTAVSGSPYALREHREYLLPIKEESGTAYIVFDNAPQIEIADDRTVICHNGWKTLAKGGEHISYPQVYVDDYFYDRMNITAESTLEELFDKWKKLRL